MNEKIEKLKTIMSLNQDLNDRMSNWSVSYDKKADMVVAGDFKNMPVDSFYLYVEDGLMLRIGSDDRIYGFGLENAKDFVRKNPEMLLPISFVMYPLRSMLFLLPFHFVFNRTRQEIKKSASVRPLSNYVISRSCFAG